MTFCMYINFEVITRGSNCNFYIRKVELALLNMVNSKPSMHCRRLWYDPKIQPVKSTIVPPEKLQESFIEARRCHQDKSGDRPVDKWLASQPLPSYLTLVKDSLPIAQEISMVLLIIALHRGLVKGTNLFCRHPLGFCTDQENLQSLIFSVILLCSLFIVIIFSKGNIETSTESFRCCTNRWNHSTNAIFYKGVDAADYANEIKNNNNSKHKVTSKRRRLFVRFVDLILLLAILRFLSSLLRSLTASFSSDTVSKLVALGWVVHLFGKEIKLSLSFY